MAELLFNNRDVKELQRQCRHHNVFPSEIADCFNGDPRPVSRVLAPILEMSIEQLTEMSFAEIQAVVNGLPSGLRHMLEPVEEPILDEDMARIAQYCIAAQVQNGYSSVSDVLALSLDASYVLGKCPELRELFDDDGLMEIDERFNLMDGAIKYGDLVLHYHQFLRRGFSANPNFSFLGSFAHYHAQTETKNRFRIAIDHRRLMKFEDYQNVMELDTWYGPSFDRDKLDDLDKIGLTVVGRSQLSPFGSAYPLLKTEFLWKANEAEYVKTLEMEEVVDGTRPQDSWHINRYVHAERDTKAKTFRHFDGAAKVYAHEGYRQRVDETMPNQMRPHRYVKLFRIDGEIDIDKWTSLVSMFFKGNEMVIEHFDPKLFEEKFRPLILRYQKAAE